jgi:transposase, IS30 family
MVTRDRDRASEGTAPAGCGGCLVEGRAASFAVVNAGVGYREAARRVGVSYRTTTYWRAAPPSEPPCERPPGVVWPRYLSGAGRVLIADRLRDSISLRSVAAGLGRAVSTISRGKQRNEKQRNAQPDGTYRPEWHVTHETLYPALCVQATGRPAPGGRHVAAQRAGDARPQTTPDERLPRMATGMVMISDRPAEAAHRYERRADE